MDYPIWRVKLAARIHDPGEKSLVLMRDHLGHEGGTVQDMETILFGNSGIPGEIQKIVKKADHWASAADRPQFPRKKGEPDPVIIFTEHPVLIHPLTAEEFDLVKLADIGVNEIKSVALSRYTRDLPADDDRRRYLWL